MPHGQHQRLFEIINALYAAIESGETRQAVEQALQSLIDYTRSHFAAEEALMLRGGYPEFPEHKKMHDQLLDKVNEYSLRLNLGENNLAADVLPFLIGDWLMEHITVTDRKYTPFLAD
jgi:hemerythrin